MTKIKDATAADLYTYRAVVVKIVDADTFWVRIDIGFGDFVNQKLRLRGIDAPEMDTLEGQKAKRFVESQFKNFTEIVVTTTKPDKYDRYLSDVFLQPEAGEEIFLNNALLETGHADRKDSFTLTDWDKALRG